MKIGITCTFLFVFFPVKYLYIRLLSHEGSDGLVVVVVTDWLVVVTRLLVVVTGW